MCTVFYALALLQDAEPVQVPFCHPQAHLSFEHIRHTQLLTYVCAAVSAIVSYRIPHALHCKAAAHENWVRSVLELHVQSIHMLWRSVVADLRHVNKHEHQWLESDHHNEMRYMKG